MSDNGAPDTADTVELAKVTLTDVCRDKRAPAAARAQAARTLLEMAGKLGRHQDSPVSGVPAEMTLEELDREIAGLRDAGETV